MTDTGHESTTAAPAVCIETHERILVVTLNRPEARNAINGEVAEGLSAAAERLDNDDKLSVGVLTGNGRGFCSGMDLKAFAAKGTPPGLDAFLKAGTRKPMVAAIEGFALAGGLELALTCDLIVAAEGAKLGIPEVTVGLFAAGGALMRLPSRLPYSVAAEMAFTGRPITAELACAFGLVNELSIVGKALERAMALAERVSANAPLAVAASKAVLRVTPGRSEEELWTLQLPFVKRVFRSDDAREGPRAFAEKRSPRWTAS